MAERQPDLLQGLSSADAAAILALGSRVPLAEGTTLFRLGSEASSLYLVERGRVTLTLPMQVAGREQDVLVEERLPGQMLGWSALIPPHRFTLNATVPLATEVLALPRQALLNHFARHSETGYTVLTNLASIIGHRLQVLQAMWLREMQRVVEMRCA